MSPVGVSFPSILEANPETTEAAIDIPDDAIVMRGPVPLSGGPVVLLRFMVRNRLFRPR